MLTRHIREYLQVTPGPFPDFWVGPGDEATLFALYFCLHDAMFEGKFPAGEGQSSFIGCSVVLRLLDTQSACVCLVLLSDCANS